MLPALGIAHCVSHWLQAAVLFDRLRQRHLWTAVIDRHSLSWLLKANREETCAVVEFQMYGKQWVMIPFLAIYTQFVAPLAMHGHS